MDTDKLERLLRRKELLDSNHTLTVKKIQNMLFYENSCIELRDQGKNVCVKAEFRKTIS